MEKTSENENLLIEQLDIAKAAGYNVLCILETDRDDKNFWATLWLKYSPSVKPYFWDLRKSGKENKGKPMIKKFLESGEKVAKTEKIRFCVDADYDILIKNAFFANKNHILHTEGYSIESHYLLPEALNHLARHSFNKSNFDFQAFFDEYSEIIFDVFCYALYFVKRQHQGEMNKRRLSVPEEMTADKLKQVIGFIEADKLINIKDNGKAGLEKIKIRAAKLIKTLQTDYPTIVIATIKEELQNDFQFVSSKTYLYMNGHIVFENIVKYLFESFKDEAIKFDLAKLKIEFKTEPNQITQEQREKQKYYYELLTQLKFTYKDVWSLGFKHEILEKVGKNIRAAFENI
jgi:hypothetical protein